jgi:hypothetical protein
MQERDSYKKIREKLLNAEVQAPDFDTLLGDETFGEASLRASCASKLVDHTAEAPDFDALFAGETLGKPLPTVVPRIRMFPWWSIASVAAASLALMLLLPNNHKIEPDKLVLTPRMEQTKTAAKSIVKHTSTLQAKHFTQKLVVPKQIEILNVEPVKIVTQEPTVVSIAVAEETTLRDTTADKTLTKINPSGKANLSINCERSVEEAYAAARVRKPKSKPERITVGAGLNGANRLLSMVNSKTNGSFALNSVATSAGEGYSSIEGASSSLLRSGSTSVNEWVGPDNITASMLQNCETTYSLPINLGLTISIPLVNNLNLITGLQYSYMSNLISSENSFTLKQELFYLGIPVKFALNLVKRGNFVIYTALGGTIEKGLAGVQNSTVDGEGSWRGTQSIRGFATSLTGQFGLSYSLPRNLLLYFEPGVAWYIPSDQPISNRTEEPFNFNLALGLRVRL